MMACRHCIYPGASCANCPENDERVPFLSCSYCGEPIEEGEWCWDFTEPDMIICSDCMDSLSTKDLAEALGYKAEILNVNTIINRTERSDGQ